MVITATSIVGRKISWNPEQFVCTIRDKAIDNENEQPTKILSVYTYHNVKEANISIEEAERILKILKTLEEPVNEKIR